jgi:glycosyltransferase involved in cell wall biosynthesis
MDGISVVIPALNAAETLGETLKALRAQVDAPSFELVVVDNGSTDGTADVARSHGAAVLYERVRGPAAARNRGLHGARGAIIAHLDADTIPSRRWLKELCAPFSSSDTVLAAGNTLCYPPRTAAERYAQSIGLHSAERTIVREEFPFAPSLNMAVRRDAALAIGGWNERLLTGEDVDFSHRLLKGGFAIRIHYCDRAIVYHRTRADDAALCKQALGYGAGAAALYRMYPDEVRWNVEKTLRLSGMLVGRTVLGVLGSAGAKFGLVKPQRAEFLRYHSLWTRHFWLGFGRRYVHPQRDGAW